MRPVNTLSLPGTALALAVLLFSYSTSKAASLASTIVNPNGSHALQQAIRKICKELYKVRRHQPGSTAHTTTGTIIVSTLTLLSCTHSQTIIVSRTANTTAMAAAK